MQRRRIIEDAAAAGESQAELQSVRARKERSDKGTLRFTPRDERVLRWIGEMMVVREDQLQVVLGRDAQRATQHDGTLALGTVARIITRWEKAGLVGVDRAFAHTPRFVWLTLKAQRDVGLPYKKTFEPERKALLRHYYYVNQARLYVEAKFGSQVKWVSERELFRRKEHIDGHYVDGLVEFEDGGVTAVEIEATIKPIVRTRTTMLALAEHYDTVTYFVLKNTRTSIERRIAELPEDVQDIFQVIALEE
jgi:hypothetical protein